MRTCHGRSLFKQNINQRRNVETGLKLTSKPIKIHREYWLFPARVTKMTDILSQLTIHNTPELAKSSDPASAQSPVTKYRTKYIFSPSNKNGNRALRNNNTLSCPIKRERPCWMMKIYSLYIKQSIECHQKVSLIFASLKDSPAILMRGEYRWHGTQMRLCHIQEQREGGIIRRQFDFACIGHIAQLAVKIRKWEIRNPKWIKFGRNWQ